MMARFLFFVGFGLVVGSFCSGCDDSAPSSDESPAPDAQIRMVRLDMGAPDAAPEADLSAPDAEPVADMMLAEPDAAPEVDAGEMRPPLDCDEDTAALPAESIGEFGPLTRINQLSVPANADAARASGCDVVGRNKGSGLANLMTTFMLDLNANVREDIDGRIETILFAELDGWGAGQTGNDVRAVTLNFLNGAQNDAGQFLIDRGSFVDNDPTAEPRVSLEATTTCESLATERGDFDISIPVEGVVISLSIAQAVVSAGLSVTPGGISMTDGLITGYLTTPGITEILRGVQAACAAESPPTFCEQAGALLQGDPATLVPLAALVLGGFDLAIEGDGTLSEDCVLDCNAISVCLKMSSEPATVVGISD